jgi:Ca2+-binding EF-hand superfamily protein
MKKLLLLITFLAATTGMIAKPEKGGKKPGSDEGRPSREEVMKKFDKDGDGKLNEEEKAELRKQMAERGAGRKVPPFIMEKFDKDGDGKLSEDERAEARKAMEARRAEMIEKFDKDGDGKLNEEERKAAMASRTKPGGEGKPDAKGKKGEKGEKKKGKKEKK